MIVGVINEECQVKYLNHYGDKNGRVEERGLSIAQITTKGDLAITGSAKKWKNCQPTVKYDDILLFRLTESGQVEWWRRYDVQNNVSVLS